MAHLSENPDTAARLRALLLDRAGALAAVPPMRTLAALPTGATAPTELPKNGSSA